MQSVLNFGYKRYYNLSYFRIINNLNYPHNKLLLPSVTLALLYDSGASVVVLTQSKVDRSTYD